MNLPNKITLFRIAILPVIVIVSLLDCLQNHFIWDYFSVGNLIILILFAIAAFSDFLDGYLARKYNLITNFGKFADPIADKLLVFTALLVLLDQNNILTAWMVIIILAREFIVTGLRTLAAEQKIVIAAGWFGKIKANFQYAMIILLLICGSCPTTIVLVINYLVIGLTLIITVASGIQYIMNYRQIFKNKKEVQ